MPRLPRRSRGRCDELTEAVDETVLRNGYDECYIRPLIWLEDGGWNLNIDGGKPGVGIAVWPWKNYLGAEALEKGVRANVSSYTRHHPNVTATKAKISGNYVNSFLAKTESVRLGFDEAILLDPQGYVAECTGANLFLVRGGKIVTPPDGAGSRGDHAGLHPDARRRPRHRGRRDAPSRATSSTSPTRSSSAARRPSASRSARSTSGRSARATAGPVTRALQEAYHAAVLGASTSGRPTGATRSRRRPRGRRWRLASAAGLSRAPWGRTISSGSSRRASTTWRWSRRSSRRRTSRAGLGNEVLLKREDLQPVFSFKLRGAYNRMVRLSPAALRRGVVAASAGNHAQGVALAAQRLGCTATIVMPVTTPRIKVEAVAARGAEVVLHGDSYDDAYAEARRLARKGRRTFVHPYDDPDVIAGQGTIGLEILRQRPAGDRRDLRRRSAAAGSIAGIAAYVKRLQPRIRVIGVEPADADAMHRSLAAGRRVTLPRGRPLRRRRRRADGGEGDVPALPEARGRGRPRRHGRHLRGDQGRLRGDALDPRAGRGALRSPA